MRTRKYIHFNSAGQPCWLSHLRKWSVSTLLSSIRAAGQSVMTKRGFPTHSDPVNTYRFRLKTRQPFWHCHSTTAYTITENTLPLSVRCLVPLIPNTPLPTLSDRPSLRPSVENERFSSDIYVAEGNTSEQKFKSLDQCTGLNFWFDVN